MVDDTDDTRERDEFLRIHGALFNGFQNLSFADLKPDIELEQDGRKWTRYRFGADGIVWLPDKCLGRE